MFLTRSHCMACNLMRFYRIRSEYEEIKKKMASLKTNKRACKYFRAARIQEEFLIRQIENNKRRDEIKDKNRKRCAHGST